MAASEIEITLKTEFVAEVDGKCLIAIECGDPSTSKKYFVSLILIDPEELYEP